MQPLPSITFANQKADIMLMQEIMDKKKEQPVLFFDQQQLAIMGIVKVDQPKFNFNYVYVTEMLMAQNDIELNNILSTLSQKPYALIVGPNLLNKQTRSTSQDPFYAENNIWMGPSYQFLSKYQPLTFINNGSIVFYEPK